MVSSGRLRGIAEENAGFRDEIDGREDLGSRPDLMQKSAAGRHQAQSFVPIATYSTFFHVLSGLKSVMARAVSSVFCPRSFW
jgi:hypothetical protein